jgi:hypothetical protein
MIRLNRELNEVVEEVLSQACGSQSVSRNSKLRDRHELSGLEGAAATNAVNNVSMLLMFSGCMMFPCVVDTGYVMLGLN